MSDDVTPGPADEVAGRSAGRRLLFVHAHPDDEASKGAATAARYVDEGAEVVLVTCTGGEAGEVLNPALADTPLDQLTGLRARELERAVEAIGFTSTYLLGERDSGWHEDLEAVPDQACFWHAPLDRPAARLATILRSARPEVVVTYPPDGGYPHPDHIRTHEVTMRALELAGDPTADGVEGEPWHVPRLLGTAVFTHERVVALHEAMLAAGHESPYADWVAPREDGRPHGQRDADQLPQAVRVDVAAWFPRRDAALLAHATQVDPDGMWFAVPRDVEARTWPWETFVALRPPAHDGPPLDDVFAELPRD